MGEMVRKEGFEPPRPFGHKILSLARLPVPPLPRGGSILAFEGGACHLDFEDRRRRAIRAAGPKSGLYKILPAGNASLEGKRLFWLRISVDSGKTREHNNVVVPGSSLGLSLAKAGSLAHR